jgi:hypothetical protein
LFGLGKARRLELRRQRRRIVGEGRAGGSPSSIAVSGCAPGAGLDIADNRLAAGVDRDVLYGNLLLTLT